MEMTQVTMGDAMKPNFYRSCVFVCIFLLVYEFIYLFNIYSIDMSRRTPGFSNVASVVQTRVGKVHLHPKDNTG